MLLGLAWRRLTHGRRLLVNLKSGTSLRGTMVRARGGGRLLELVDVVVVADAGQPLSSPVKADGSAIIDVNNVDFVQAVVITEAIAGPGQVEP